MARPRKEPHERRTERHNVRFTAAELAYIQDQAEAVGLDVTEYLRRRALRYEVPSVSRRAVDPALVSELNRIGVNVNQLARAVHAGRDFAAHWRTIGEELTAVLERVVRQEA